MDIVFLGDSLVWGQYGGDFVAEVAKQLPEHTVVNAGVGGDTVVNLLHRVDEVIETHKPDMIIISVGGNDAVSYSMPAVRSYYRQAKGLDEGFVSPEYYETAYRNLLTRIQLDHIQPIVMLAPTEYNAKLIDMRQQYNQIASNIADAMNIDSIDLASHVKIDIPVVREDVQMGFILDIGKRNQSGWNDFEAERKKWGYTYTFDGMHILPETAPKFAKIILDYLKQHLT